MGEPSEFAVFECRRMCRESRTWSLSKFVPPKRWSRKEEGEKEIERRKSAMASPRQLAVLLVHINVSAGMDDEGEEGGGE